MSIRTDAQWMAQLTGIDYVWWRITAYGARIRTRLRNMRSADDSDSPDNV